LNPVKSPRSKRLVFRTKPGVRLFFGYAVAFPHISSGENPVTEFANNNSRNRYEMTVDGAVAFINYQMKDGAVALTHTEVPESLSGQGVGSKLVQNTLNDIRDRGLKLIPYCTFVKNYLEKHPEYQDIVLQRG
jgi:predicted GNAT family acetyltransferase